MKIVCPECQAAYEIDVPDSPSKDLSAKCAVCNTKFPIKKRSLAKSNPAHDSMTGPHLAQIDSGLAPDSTDDFLSGLQEDLENIEKPDLLHDASTDDKTLDDYLDQLLTEGLGEPGQEALAELEPQPETDSASTTSEIPSEDDLDHLFDSLIEEEIKSPVKEEDTADLDIPSENDQEEAELDALLDEIILTNLDDKDEPKAELDAAESITIGSEPPTNEVEEINEPVSELLEDTEQEAEIPEPENISSEEKILSDVASQEDSKETSEDPQETTDSAVVEQQDDEKSDEDLWAEAFADQETLKETDDKEPTAEQKEDVKSDEDSEAKAPADQETLKETDDKEPTAEQKDDEKSDEDLWAEAFADQEALKETDDKEPTAEQKDEEKSDEDLWAEAFADQEALKETDDEESTAEQKEDVKSDEGSEAKAPADQETLKETDDKESTAEQKDEEKSDEDLWAEAFADQEALSETDDEESTAEQKEDVKSDEDGDSEEKADEMSEAVDPDQEEAETEVTIDEAVDSDEDEDPVEEEETETNEFGISESDYDDDDDYGEDESEFSPPEKKKSLLSLPSTRTGKLIFAGSVLAILLTGGGAYFALQTLAPPELTQMGKNTSEVPEGLQPKDVKESPASKNQNVSAPAEKSNPALTAALGTGGSPSLDVDAKNANATNPASEAESSGVSSGLVAALAPGNHAVQLATIMPVAYNINDIRVLSFNLEAEMSDAQSAQVVREALPVFEKITVTTVEQLMDQKFFNDILYVKEKLKKNLQNNFNKTLEGGGRVKKITFKEFTVQ